jgi:flavin-dependent dehydrogenase
MESQLEQPFRLRPGSRIAVVGGGPAGSFFALHALQLARRLRLPVRVTIFESRDFTAVGPPGCNMCAGILSRRTLDGLAALGLPLGPEVIMGRIRAFQFHWGDTVVAIRAPDASREAVSVYRAGGPGRSPHAPTAGFDELLLRHAEARGARIVPERVERVAFGPLPRVRTSRREEEFDLAVLAGGVNAAVPELPEVGYVPPATEPVAQNELYLRAFPNPSSMEGNVHVYLDRPQGLFFGALVPKGHFASVSLLGKGLTRRSIDQFLEVPEVARLVGEEQPRACSCQPRIAVGVARRPFGDRFVAVGDACVTRLYKDGIGSAWATARAAAETALRHGVDREAFALHYAPLCRAMDRDTRFGRLVFGLVHLSKRSRSFMRALTAALQEESEGRRAPVVSRILWSLFTGDASYASILRSMLHPRAVLRTLGAMWRAVRRPGPVPLVGE